MAHVRKQIREAAAAALAGLSTTGARVYQSRVYPLKDADLPCLLINTDDEEIAADTGVTALVLERTLRLSVRGVARATADLDDVLDGIAEQVEPVLNGATFSGKAKQTVLAGMRVQMEDTQDKPVGVIDMAFTVTYFTAGSAPGTAI